MAGAMLTVGTQAICSHAGQVSVVSTNTRVTAGGQPVATMADQFLVAACAFAPGAVPQPCLRVQWLVPAARVTVMGQPVVLQTSNGLGIGPTQAPQGPATVIVTQPRVTAS